MTTHQDRIAAFDRLWDEHRSLIAPLDEARHPKLKQALDWFSQKVVHLIAPNYEKIEFEIIDTLSPEKPREDGPQNPLFGIFLMFEQDRELGPPFSLYVNKFRFGGYNAFSHIISINMASAETLRFMTLVLLHELRHAYYAEDIGHVNANKKRSKEDRLKEEVDLWTQDYKITYDIGSSYYREAVRQGVMYALEVEESSDCDSMFWHSLSISLKDCWGEVDPDNIEALCNRVSSFRIYCQLMAADEYLSPEKAQQRKFEIIKNFYNLK
jgi:hypothetical protein